jgi:hypothetical protein
MYVVIRISTLPTNSYLVNEELYIYCTENSLCNLYEHRTKILIVCRSIESYQVILPNADSTRCPIVETSSVSPIEVEMFLANESSIFDHRLTLDFYTFWRESGLPDFPFDVSYLKWTASVRTVVPAVSLIICAPRQKLLERSNPEEWQE